MARVDAVPPAAGELYQGRGARPLTLRQSPCAPRSVPAGRGDSDYADGSRRGRVLPFRCLSSLPVLCCLALGCRGLGVSLRDTYFLGGRSLLMPPLTW